jgi:hypothetical protein
MINLNKHFIEDIVRSIKDQNIKYSQEEILLMYQDGEIKGYLIKFGRLIINQFNVNQKQVTIKHLRYVMAETERTINFLSFDSCFGCNRIWFGYGEHLNNKIIRLHFLGTIGNLP